MRILHVTDAYLPKQGGIEVQVRDLASRQTQAGHEVDVLTCAPAHDTVTPPGRSNRAPDDELPLGPRTDGQTADDTQPDDRAPAVYRVQTPWSHIRATDTALRRRRVESTRTTATYLIPHYS